ncbi:hypothetical protein [Candidatus Nitrosacidococcus sp. I8]|uniref:hypothetical protein n=1 Tax=Candidatus Nitrosacidococcus sp. I8 TaxID=2942908 RepID=UPI002226AB24|nr:hypothetical protein [Candidatus Nitrosacidococcus sp. I8]CAH9018660.1 hypothetical protein NURINAE_01058 [Candidatus Nitrosacidococcus sp. I8]
MLNITHPFKVFLLATWATGITIILFFCLKLTDGYLIYSLDDPYIHMAVADNILHGNYGINLGEYASPSSSILWPWLLTIPEVIGLGMSGPLILNLIFTATTLYIASDFIIKEGLIRKTSIITQAVIGLSLIAFTSSLALPFTGMEHSLHVLLTVAVFIGLVNTTSDGRNSWYLIPAIVLLPLIRFEGYALSGTAILYLFFIKQRKEAIITGALILTATIAYVVYMVTKDLPILPSSVLMKSQAVTSLMVDTKINHAIIDQFKENIATIKGNFFLATTGLLFIHALLMWKDYRNRSLICIAVAMTITAHLFLGREGWFARYEVYCITLSCLSILFIISDKRSDNSEMSKLAVIMLMLSLIISSYIKIAFVTPYASRAIYEQQYQMRRFAQDFYHQPIGVNDLGLVSYKNPNYVLDLWGLGSEEVRRLKLEHEYNIDAMEHLLTNHHVGLIMIYDRWFPQVPKSWKPIANLINQDRYTTGGNTVTLYVTPEADQAKLFEDLEKFKNTLPKRVALEIFNN